MKREYELCTWTLDDISLEEKCKKAVEIGVGGLDIEGNISMNTENIKHLFNKYNLKLLSVTPENVDISSIDPIIRENAIQYYLNLLELSNKLGIARIGYHGDVGKVQGSENRGLD